MQAVVITGTLTSGSNVIASPSSIVGLAIGQRMVGAGVPSAATITILSPLTLSANATVSGALVQLVAVPLGYTLLTALNIQDDTGILLANGTVSVQPTDGNDHPITATVGSAAGGPITTAAASWAVTSGAIPAGSVVPDTTLTRPANICYRITIANAVGVPIYVLRLVQPSGPVFSLDTFTPNVAGQAIVQMGPPGPQGPPGVSPGVMHYLSNGQTGANQISGAIDGTSNAYTIPGTPLQVVVMFRNDTPVDPSAYTFSTANAFSWTTPLQSGDHHGALVIYPS